MSRRIEPLASGRKALVQRERGRICDAMNCDTWLSIYNELDVCSLHDGFPEQTYYAAPMRSAFAVRPITSSQTAHRA